MEEDISSLLPEDGSGLIESEGEVEVGYILRTETVDDNDHLIDQSYHY